MGKNITGPEFGLEKLRNYAEFTVRCDCNDTASYN